MKMMQIVKFSATLSAWHTETRTSCVSYLHESRHRHALNRKDVFSVLNNFNSLMHNMSMVHMAQTLSTYIKIKMQ
ncbi:hypothetical protein Lal_00003725 [Lupinus albus]|nr:hypothetical protein Lal_00003725 [Lupinus albus]